MRITKIFEHEGIHIPSFPGITHYKVTKSIPFAAVLPEVYLKSLLCPGLKCWAAKVLKVCMEYELILVISKS